jgi:hypothetical protein
MDFTEDIWSRQFRNSVVLRSGLSFRKDKARKAVQK